MLSQTGIVRDCNGIGWYPYSTKPQVRGVYKTSRTDIINLANAYGFWDGTKWQPYRGWGNHSESIYMIWRGRLPIEHYTESNPYYMGRT